MKPKCLPGYWSGKVECEAGVKVMALPSVILSSRVISQDEISKGADRPSGKLAQAIYTNSHKVLTLIFQGQSYRIEDLGISKIGEITALPKSQSVALSLQLSLYHMVPKEHEYVHYFFVVDGNENILAYTRFHQKSKSPSLKSVYADNPVLTIEAIQSFKRGEYSLGSILIQAIVEFGIKSGINEGVAVYSVENSGQFYKKLGFTSLEPSIYHQLEENIDTNGELMFLTDKAFAAWEVKIAASPITLISEEGLQLQENKQKMKPTVSEFSFLSQPKKRLGETMLLQEDEKVVDGNVFSA